MYHEDGPIEHNAHLTAAPATEVPAPQGENKARPRKSSAVARCSNQLQSTTQMALWNRKDTRLHVAISLLLGLGVLSRM